MERKFWRASRPRRRSPRWPGARTASSWRSAPRTATAACSISPDWRCGEGLMFVKVSAGGVTLEDRDNFRAFKLVVEGLDLDAARRALAGIAELPDRDTAWIFEAALRQRAEVTASAAWQQAFGAMI